MLEGITLDLFEERVVQAYGGSHMSKRKKCVSVCQTRYIDIKQVDYRTLYGTQLRLLEDLQVNAYDEIGYMIGLIMISKLV